ncbi:hypothetical protein [Glycomyces tritici]|uniref:Uncharacterized protein n=1 Tax=Glycomyces tritici TaxID=2665176 RepID=A0ABT7YM87_9ACTN|nr:hypothetical protein [Glycomyces tritici]MDN3239524.1 hypothetical protein [Glycomyces tritici]
MGNQSKPRNCKRQHRTRVVLDEAEIRRRLSKPKRPTLAEQYAEATDAAQRERFYAEATDRDRQWRATAAANSLSALPPPRRPDTRVWVTQPILRIRGWTDAAIRDFLPAPECHRSNPHEQARRPMPLWSAVTVARAESTAAWRQWLRASLDRRGLTLRDLANSARGAEFRKRVRTAHAAIAAAKRAAPEPRSR